MLGKPRKDEDTLTGDIGRGDDGRRALVDDPSQGKSAVTHFRVIERFPRAAHLEFSSKPGAPTKSASTAQPSAVQSWATRSTAAKSKNAAAPPPAAPLASTCRG